MEIILIRHTAVDVPPGTCYGQTDVPLKADFEEDAAVTREKLADFGPIDCAYTGPLSRCTRLAEFCGYGDAERDARLMEINFGDWEMQLFDAIADPRIQEWYDDYLNVPATGGESFMLLYKRVCDFLDELRTKPWNRVAIFTHGGVLLSAQVYAGLITPQEAFYHQTPYGGLVIIRC